MCIDENVIPSVEAHCSTEARKCQNVEGVSLDRNFNLALI